MWWLVLTFTAAAVLPTGDSQFNDGGGYGQFGFGFENSIKTLREP